MIDAIRSAASRLLRFASGSPIPLGAIPTSGQHLKYDGTSIVGTDAPGGGGTPTPTAVGDMIGTTDGAAWAKRTTTQVRSDLGLGTAALQASSAFQAANAALTAVVDAGTVTTGDVLAAPAGTPAWSTLSEAGIQPKTVSSASDPTVNDDSGDGYAVGQVWVNTTTDVPFMLADATVGAAVWRSLLSCATRIYCYIADGNPLAVRQALSGATWVNIGTPVAPDTTQADVAATITPAGTGYTSAAGYGAASDQMSECWRAIWKIDGTGNLAVTWNPTTSGTMVVVNFTSDQSTTTYHLEGGVIGHATTPATWTFGGGLGHALSNPALVGVSDNDTTASVACTTTAPGVAVIISSAAASARTAIVVGRSTGGATIEDSFSAVGASWDSPSVGLWAGRPVLGGGSLVASNLTAAFDFLPGELSP